MRARAAAVLRRVLAAGEAAALASTSSSAQAAVSAQACWAAACRAAGPSAAELCVGRCLRPLSTAGFATTASNSGHEAAQRVLAADVKKVGPEVLQLVDSVDAQGIPAVARAAAVTGITDPAFLQHLATAAVRAMPSLSTCDLCSIVESMSDLHNYNIAFKDAMAEHVLSRLDEFSGDQLGKTLRAFGSMQYYDDALLEGVVAHIMANPTKFSAENIADVAYAFSKCGFCHPDLLEVVGTAAGKLLEEAEEDRGEAIASVLEAYSRVGCSDPDTVDRLVNRIAQKPEAFEALCLAKTIIATVRLGYEDDRLLVPLLNTAVDKLDDLPPKSIVKMINCLGDLGYSHTRLLDTVTDVTIPNRLHEFSLEGLSDLVNSLNKLGYYNRKFMTLMASLDSGKGGLQPAVA